MTTIQIHPEGQDPRRPIQLSPVMRGPMRAAVLNAAIRCVWAERISFPHTLEVREYGQRVTYRARKT